MKFAPAIFLPVLGGLLASCCCQEHVSHRSGRPSTTRVAPQPAVVIPQVDEQEANIVLVLGPQNPLPVSLRNQECYYSCWATCAEMIMDFIGRHVSQCEQASPPVSGYEFACCDADGRLGAGSDCDEPSLPDFWRWGFDCFWQQSPNVLSWQQVKDEIDGGRPFAFSYIEAVSSSSTTNPQNQISHMRVAIGYNEANGVQTITCLDPHGFSITHITMMHYSEYSGNGSVPITPGTPYFIHEFDFFGITLAQP